MRLPMRVGVFDSGVGGLNVLAQCMRQLPEVQYYYYGDNANAPYGLRQKEEVVRFVDRAMEQFASLHVDAAILACNTVTALCARELREKYPFPIIGMEPAVRPAASVCRDVLVLATPHTVQSERFRRLVNAFPNCRFTVYALPRLAGEIERCLARGTMLTLSDHLPDCSPDGVVLGCTHYIYFRREIARFYACPVFDGVSGTVNRLERVLFGREETEQTGIGDHHCPATNPNNCLTKKYKEGGPRGVKWLGSGKKINKKVLSSNICFTFD